MRLCITGLLVLLSAHWADGEDAARLYRQARKAQSAGDYSKAYLLSSQAVALDPNNPEYWSFSTAVRSQGLAGLQIGTAQSQPAPAAQREPEPDLPGISPEDEREARDLRPPPVLQGSGERPSFKLKADARQLFEQVLSAYGLKVVFDADYPASGPQVSFEIEDAGWRAAIRALEAMSGSFVVPVSERIALVAKDTTQKRTEIEPVMSVIIPFPEPLTPQEIQEAARAVQGVFDMTRMGVDNARRQVLFRDRVSRLRPAIELFQQLMVHRAQVVTDIELLAVNQDSALRYGISLPTSLSLPFVAGPLALPLIPLGSNWQLAMGLMNASIFASMSRGSTQSLVKGELRGVDGQPANMHIGDRYPIMTAGYFGDTSGPGKVYTPPPTVNFEDLGVVLKVTPHVHGMREVTLEVEAEFKALGGAALNGIPVITNRKFAASVRMKFGEAALMAGLVRDTITQSWSGIPGLSAIPAFRSNNKSVESTQMLLTLTPRLVNLPPSEVLTVPVWVGTESRPLTPLD